MTSILSKLPGWADQSVTRGQKLCWVVIFVLLVPYATFVRFYFLSNPLVEPQPIRQTQTALTIRQMARGQATVLDYRSPLDGKLWSFVHEFPLYQWIASKLVQTGVSVEVSARLVSIFFFFLGTIFLFLIARHFFGEWVAGWTALLYFTSPLNVFYSRTSLIDNTAIALVLAGAYFTIRTNRTSTLILAFLCGALGAVTKPTSWYATTAILFLYTLYRFKHKQISTKWTFLTIAQLTLQLICVVAWIKWAVHIRGESGAFVGQDTLIWTIGTLSDRFEIERWLKLTRWIVRQCFYDWMIIPFILAFFGKFRTIAWVLLATTVFSMILPFQVHTVHDYYLLAETPYLHLICGLGVVSLFQSSKWIKILSLMAIGAILAYRMYTIEYAYSTIYEDYNDAVQQPRLIGELTSTNDLVFADIGREAWQYALYSDRLIIAEPYFDQSNLTPSVYWFNSNSKSKAYLETIDAFWLYGTAEMVLVRTKSVDTFDWNQQRDIWIGNHPPLKDLRTIPFSTIIDTCDKHTLVKLGDSKKVIKVSTDNLEIQIPTRRFLYLPRQSPWGCKYRLELSDGFDKAQVGEQSNGHM